MRACAPSLKAGGIGHVDAIASGAARRGSRVIAPAAGRPLVRARLAKV